LEVPLKSVFVVFSIILLMAVLSGLPVSCTSPAESTPPAPLTITDQLGRTVTLKTATPRRIVSLAPSHTETIYALGIADRLAAVTDYCNYPPEAKEKPSIGGFSTPNIEEIVAMEPDLILATGIHEDKVILQLESKGLTVVAVNPMTIDDVIESITLVGKVTGAAEQAADLLDDMQKRIKAVTDKTAGLNDDEKPRVLFVVWHDPLMAAGSATLHDELIRMAGGINIAGDLEDYADISLEAVLTANPQVIIAGIGMGSGEDLPFQYLNTEPRLEDTDARRDNSIYPINQDLVGRPGPRVVKALEQFAEFIHPELFR
jgi:iron complex transport system substrate-binding protein